MLAAAGNCSKYDNVAFRYAALHQVGLGKAIVRGRTIYCDAYS
jgi:hypothetical protein